MTDGPEMLTVDEAAMLYRCKPAAIRRRIARGELPSVKPLGRVLIPRRHVEADLGLTEPTEYVRRRQRVATSEYEKCMLRLTGGAA